MTTGQRSVEAVSPMVRLDVFKGRRDYRYWIGSIGASRSESEALLFEAVGRLRAAVYVNEMQFLASDVVDSNGLEFDEDDQRSVHFVVVENVSNESDALARLVGYGRLIIKRSSGEKLPIEKLFSGLFKTKDAGPGSVEVSRFISRHGDKLTQHTIGLSVIRAMSYFCVRKNIDSAYFQIEKPLFHLLRHIGLPMSQLDECRDVIEPGGKRTLYPISVNPFHVVGSVKTDAHNNLLLRDFFEKESGNDGIGYYPADLVSS